MYQGKSVDAYGRSSIFIVKWLVAPSVRGGRSLDHFYKTIITWHSWMWYTIAWYSKHSWSPLGSSLWGAWFKLGNCLFRQERAQKNSSGCWRYFAFGPSPSSPWRRLWGQWTHHQVGDGRGSRYPTTTTTMAAAGVVAGTPPTLRHWRWCQWEQH